MNVIPDRFFIKPERGSTKTNEVFVIPDRFFIKPERGSTKTNEVFVIPEYLCRGSSVF